MRVFGGGGFFVFHPQSFFAERKGTKLTEGNIRLQLVKRARTLQAMEIKKGKKKLNYKEVLDSVSSAFTGIFCSS